MSDATGEPNKKIIAIVVVVVLLCCSLLVAFMTKGGDKNEESVPTSQVDATPRGVAVPKSAPVKVFKLEPKSTPDNDAGGGNMIYLDRHDITCDKKPINQFRLNYPSGNQMKYDYKCVSSFDDQTLEDKQTPSNDWGGGNMIFADRHVVDCQTKPITRLHLTRPTAQQIAYQYRCGNTTSSTCRETTSAETAEISSSRMLTNLDVVCDDGEYLSKVHLTRKSPGKFHYKYTCCK